MKPILRQIGRSTLTAAPLAFGGNIFGWTVDEESSFHLLDAFVAAGLNLIDTADIYSNWVPGNSGGESETILGKWMQKRGSRDRVLLATKVGMEMRGKKGLSKAHIFQSVEASLKRLQTDHIDLYYSHKDDPTLSVEEPLEAYAELIQQGKVRIIGASNFSAKRLEEALCASKKHGYPRYECLQPLYNLYDRLDYEGELQTICSRHELSVFPYFSLASGFLTGKYRSKEDLQDQKRAGILERYFTKRGERILKALAQVAEKTQATSAQIAIAWLLAQQSVTAPIASATSLHQLQALMKATQLALDPESLALLNQASL